MEGDLASISYEHHGRRGISICIDRHLFPECGILDLLGRGSSNRHRPLDSYGRKNSVKILIGDHGWWFIDSGAIIWECLKKSKFHEQKIGIHGFFV